MVDPPVGLLLFLLLLIGVFTVVAALGGDLTKNMSYGPTTPDIFTPRGAVPSAPAAGAGASCETDADVEDDFCDDCGEYSDTLQWREDGQLRCDPCQAFRDHPELTREVLQDGGFVPDLIVCDLGLDVEDDDPGVDEDAEPDPDDDEADAAAVANNWAISSLPSAAATKPTPVILPPFARVFEATGWVSTILAHVDVIRYYDHPYFQIPTGGQAVGFAHYEDGLRWIDVATNGRSDIAVCWTIAHEIGHLYSVAQSGQLSYDEVIAQSFADRFLRDAAAVYGWEACR